MPGASVLRSVDCWARGSCAAVGIQQFPRTPSLQVTEGLVETLAGGVWTYGNAPVPSNGIAGTSYTVLRQVSCPSGVCEAEGEYTIYNDQPGLFEAWRN